MRYMKNLEVMFQDIYIGPITNGDYSYLEFLSLFNTIEKTSSEPT